MLNEYKGKKGEDLTEAAVQRCSLKYFFLKESRILKNVFKKVTGGKPAASLKITLSEFFFSRILVCMF